MFNGIFKLFIIFVERLRLSVVRPGSSDGNRLKMAWEFSKKHAKEGAKAGSPKSHPVPILEVQKRHAVPKLEAQKGTMSSGTSPVLSSIGVAPLRVRGYLFTVP